MWPFKETEKEKETCSYDMSDYKVGMLVKLMSGGPVMTVSKLYTNGLDCCYYNTKTQKYCILIVYDPAVLHKVKDGCYEADERINK
jgi:uncharacterized protein YodC (DUF2158 family)